MLWLWRYLFLLFSVLCDFHIFGNGLLLCNSVCSLPSGPTMNNSQWQTLKICCIRWFGVQGLSPYRLGPVTGPPRTQQKPEALVWEGLFLVISAYGYRKEEPKMGMGYGALERLSQCIQALAVQWCAASLEITVRSYWRNVQFMIYVQCQCQVIFKETKK